LDSIMCLADNFVPKVEILRYWQGIVIGQYIVDIEASEIVDRWVNLTLFPQYFTFTIYPYDSSQCKHIAFGLDSYEENQSVMYN